MLNILSEDPNVIYQFWIEVDAPTEKEGKKNAMTDIKACEDFAGSLGILCECSTTRIVNQRMSVRIQFNVRAPKNMILQKVAALFCFATARQLYFANQFFLSK